ncbi:MAG: glutamate mutase L [Anaerolineae bacterium]|nr:glutamate mutase L [Anaerolineae bacterium]
MAEQRSGSILAVDFGNVQTRALLIDLVDGFYRLVARGDTRTTAGFPANDARLGLNRVVDQITSVTGRKLLTTDGKVISPEQNDRSGVDYFVMTASTGRTMRTVLVGLVPDVSIASARRALAGTYVEIVESMTLEDGRSQEEEINAIVASRPDLIFITGGMEGGAEEPVLRQAKVVQQALRLIKGGRKPAVLYAGNSALGPTMRDLFGALATIFIAPNVRPTLDEEELEGAQAQLALVYNDQQAKRGGFGAITRMSRNGVLPTAQSYNLITDYLGQSSGHNVLTVDIGSAVGILSAYIDKHVTTSIRTDIGLGHSADSLLGTVGEAAINRWLPFITTSNQIRHYALNKTLVPGSIPETIKGTFLEHAFLRAGIGALAEASRPTWSKQLSTPQNALTPHFHTIIGAGAGLTQTGSSGFGALLLLDALQATGTARIQMDSFGVVAALGSLAYSNQEAVVQVLESSSLETLGTVFSVTGVPAINRPVMHVRIKTSDGQVVKHHVPGGHLWVFPLGIGKTATVDVSVGRGLNIGGKGRVKMTAEGGTVGLIFDGRGRPLPLALDAQGRAAQIPMWIAEMTGNPQTDIPSDWLTDAIDDSTGVEMEAEDAVRKAKDRGGLFGGGRRKTAPAPAAKPKQSRPEAEAAVAEKSSASVQNELDDLRGG